LIAVTDTTMGGSVPKEELISMGFLNPDGSPADPDEFKSIPVGAATYVHPQYYHLAPCLDTRHPSSYIVAAFDPSIKRENGSYLSDAVVSQDKVATHAKDPVSLHLFQYSQF
jgi:hypothetical protein